MSPEAEETKNMDEFQEGIIEYEILANQEIAEVMKSLRDLSDWFDGYLAFSNYEKRLDESIKKLKVGDLLSRKFKCKDIAGIPDAQGYLMEIGLWCGREGEVEEICVEREDAGFHIQKWSLHKTASGANNGFRCYYRYVDVLPRKNTKIFKEGLNRACEVVVQEKRLHFFLICGRGN